MSTFPHPKASEIIREFGCTVAQADEIEAIFADCDDYHEADTALQKVSRVLGWAGDVRRMVFDITHHENPDAVYTSEHVGYILDRYDGEEATFAFCDGTYLKHAHGNRTEGFYITSEAEERELFETYFTDSLSPREQYDYEEWLGPRDDDLYTYDGIAYYHYREGGMWNRGKRLHAFTIRLRSEEDTSCPACASDDVGCTRDEPSKYGWKKAWKCYDCEHEWVADPAPATEHEDSPWSFFSDHEKAIWRLIIRFQQKDGYGGNVWQADDRNEWRLLRFPKGLGMEPWRDSYRKRIVREQAKKDAAAKRSARAAERRRAGLPSPQPTRHHGRPYGHAAKVKKMVVQSLISRPFPGPGDLVFYGKGPGNEASFWKLGDKSLTPAITYSAAEVSTGVAVMKLRTRLLRTAERVWRAHSRGTDPQYWKLVYVAENYGFDGLRRRRAKGRHR